MTDHIISASILPLEDKHYGTNIRLVLDNKRTILLNVWIPVGSPSDEECASWGVTREQWEANIEHDDGWGGTCPIQELIPCDSHYQSQYEFEVCQEIVAALGNYAAQYSAVRND